jgi:type II secretory ATPase GspE/PulE/Tfp pilus assembly ATPase PilB-like protein
MKVDPDTVFYHGRGCNECNNTGMAGRKGIFELLRVTSKVRELIASRPTADQIERAAPEDHVSMLRQGVSKVLQGITTPEEVFRVAKSITED